MHLTILTPAPPCDKCHGTCCTTGPGHETLAALEPEEHDRFPEAVVKRDGTRALPVTAAGRCIHLGDDSRCQIYDRRPIVCQQFNCLFGYWLGRNRHGFFLQDHPEVVELIELTYPDFVAARNAERLQRPIL